MILQTIRVKNYKNLKDVVLNLETIQLFIGPNNTGKSNLLELIQNVSFILNNRLVGLGRKDINSGYYHYEEREKILKKFYDSIQGICEVQLDWKLNEFPEYLVSMKFEIENSRYNCFWGIFQNRELPNLLEEDVELEKKFVFENTIKNFYRESNNYSYSSNSTLFDLDRDTTKRLNDQNYLQLITKIYPTIYNYFLSFANSPIYEINPKLMQSEYGSTGDKLFLNNGENVLSFLESFRDYSPKNFEKIGKDLNLFTKNFYAITFDRVKTDEGSPIRKKFPNDTIKKFGLIDKDGKTIWANHLSDGVLYFLAILCIVNHPSPPPILMIEEPEKGIHPRRIKEILDLLFKLSEDKKIQIILTTHSTFVVDEFSQVPESVSIFNNHDGIISIENLKDRLDKINSNFEKNGYTKEDLQGSLGENWALGLLGGIPE